MSDWELLKNWADDRSDAAFGELVRRYVNLVYGSEDGRVLSALAAKDHRPLQASVFVSADQRVMDK